MGLVGILTERAIVPHEPDQWMEFRRLSWRDLEKAASVRTSEAVKAARDMGGELLRELQQFSPNGPQTTVIQYDNATLLRKAIVAWSYDAPVCDDTIDDLDQETAEWALNVITERNLERSKEQRKKGS